MSGETGICECEWEIMGTSGVNFNAGSETIRGRHGRNCSGHSTLDFFILQMMMIFDKPILKCSRDMTTAQTTGFPRHSVESSCLVRLLIFELPEGATTKDEVLLFLNGIIDGREEFASLMKECGSAWPMGHALPYIYNKGVTI
jgi:hypothetical protein